MSSPLIGSFFVLLSLKETPGIGPKNMPEAI